MLTFVQVSLLVAGIAAFLWAVPYEDCGLLDEFFEVVQTNSSTVIELADLQLTSQYFLRLLERRLFQPGGGVNLELLQFLPADLGGGETGVAAARKAPNRSPIVSIIIITILVFMCLCCLVVVVLTCACCSRCNDSCYRKAQTRGRSNKLVNTTMRVYFTPNQAGSDMISSYGSSRSSLLDQLNNGAILNLLQSPGAHRGMRICHLLLTVLSGVFLFGLLVSICVYLYGGALPASTLASSSPAGTTSASVEASTKQLSILSAVQYTKDKIITFLKVGTSTGVALTEQFVAQLDGNLNLSLASGVHEAMNALLKEYNIRSLLDTGKQLQVDVQILDGNMLFIRKTNQDTIGQVSRLQGALKVIYDLITSELGTLCQRGLGSNLDAQCAKLQANSQVLIINLDPSAINTDPPAVLNFVLNEFGINLQEILNMFGEATKKLEATERDILQKVLQFVDVQSVLSPLISFWQQLDVQVDRTNTSAQATVNYIENGVTLAKPFLLLTIYLPVVIFIVLLATAIILFVLFLFEALEGNLFLAEPPANHQGSPILPDLAMSSKVCSNCGFTAYAVIMILIMFLMGGLLLILPLTMLLASGGCTYLESTSGVAKTDYLLNNYMQKAWPQIVARIINSSSANDKLTEFLLLEPPRGLIKAMTMSCWNSTKMETMKGANVGLLNLIGWQTIIDVPKVIQSDLVNGTIQKGEQVLLDEIKKADIAGFLPKDLTKMAELAMNLTQYFDKMDYGPSIEQLRPDLLPAATLSAFANELETFGKAVQDLGLSSAEILLRAAQLINVEIPKVQGAAVNVSQLRAAFENVQNRRNLTTSINNLVVGLDDTLKIVSNEATLLAPVPGIYQNLVKQFLTQMQIDLSDQVFQLTRRLLPCVELYQATSSSLAATCHQEGLLSRIYAWTLSLALCLLFTLLFFFNVFILSIVQSQQFSRLGIRNNPLEERARQLSVSERYVQGPGFSSALPTTPQLVPHLPTDAIGVPQGVVFGRTFQPY
uniref:Prominin-1-A n=1 Tax=Schistocephalus solidus TaxID=70667 RepID=A0A0X3PC51_SCHSO